VPHLPDTWEASKQGRESDILSSSAPLKKGGAHMRRILGPFSVSPWGLTKRGDLLKYIVRRFLTLLAAVVVGALLIGLGELLGEVYIAGGWAEGIIIGGLGGAVFGILYDPRAATYTVHTRGGAEYPGDWDDYRP